MFISYLGEKAEILDTCTDHLERFHLHFSAEQDNYISAHFLLKIEHCGATPLMIAVCEKKQEFCKLLVKCNADVRGSTFMGIPSPLEMAKKIRTGRDLRDTES